MDNLLILAKKTFQGYCCELDMSLFLLEGFWNNFTNTFSLSKYYIKIFSITKIVFSYNLERRQKRIKQNIVLSKSK